MKQNLTSMIAVQWGGAGSYAPFNLIGDFEIMDPANLTPEFCAANGLVEPTNYEQGMSLKVLALNALLDPCWATAANLNAMAVSRDADGYLSSIGKLWYRHGGEVRHFSACKAPSLQILGTIPSVAGPGSLFARIFLYGYGTELAPGAPAFAATTPMGIYKPEFTDFKATDLGAVSVADVFAYAISLSNGLIPFVTLPLPATGGEILAQDCANGPLTGGIMLDQLKESSATQDGTDPSVTKQIIIRLKTAGGAKLVFTAQTLLPNRTSPGSTVGISRIRREYGLIKPNAGTTSITIAAGA